MVKHVGMRNEASPESVESSIPSSLYPSAQLFMRIESLEALRLLAADHPSTESDYAAFCPPRMGRK